MYILPHKVFPHVASHTQMTWQSASDFNIFMIGASSVMLQNPPWMMHGLNVWQLRLYIRDLIIYIIRYNLIVLVHTDWHVNTNNMKINMS
jgi:hypothetical protein